MFVIGVFNKRHYIFSNFFLSWDKISVKVCSDGREAWANSCMEFKSLLDLSGKSEESDSLNYWLS